MTRDRTPRSPVDPEATHFDVHALSTDPVAPTLLVRDLPALVLAERYRIEAVLGRGGMGTVYLALDALLDERVAVKVLGVVEGEAELEAARSEVKLARRVAHPNVARTFDVARHEQILFLTMEYVDGSSLAAIVLRASAAHLAKPIAEGLAAIHAASVVHADLKPENVLVTKSGMPKITDFGIAGALELSARERRRGAGTPRYMAPELLRGAPPDERSDVYAFGVLLHELVAGRRVDKDGPPPIEGPLAPLARACVSPDPRLRPENAARLVEMLASLSSSRGPGAMSTPDRAARVIALEPFLAETPEAAPLAVALEAETRRLLGTVSGLVVEHATDDARARAEAIVHASVVLRADGTARVGLRLVAAAEGLLVGSSAFVAAPDAVMPPLAASCAAIAEGLAARGRTAVAALPHPDVTRLYLQARSAEHAWRTGDRTAIECLEQALALRPDDERVLAAYALLLARTHPGPGAPLLSVARAAAERALAAAPNDADAHLAMAVVRMMENDIVAAAQAAHRASTLAPSLATAHSLLGVVATEVGAVAEGLERLALARALDPRESIATWATLRTLALTNDPAADALDGALLDDVLGRLLGARIALWRGREVAWPVRGDLGSLRALAGDPDRLRQRAMLRETSIEVLLAAGDEAAAAAELDALANEDLSADALWVAKCPLLGALRSSPAGAAITLRAQAVAAELGAVLARY